MFSKTTGALNPRSTRPSRPPMRRYRVGAIAALIVAGLFGSFLQTNLTGAIGTEYPLIPAITLAPDTSEYVALGDSFSSGEGVEPFLDGTGEDLQGGVDCHRSRQAYAMRLTFTSPVKRVFRACSGAVIDDLLTGQRPGVEPQIVDGVLNERVGLVTLTIGGNDAGFVPMIRHCVLRLHCMDDVFSDKFDDGEYSDLTLERWAEQKLASLASRLAATYRMLREGAPNARIVVLGYPYLFPQNPSSSLMSADCAFLKAVEVLDLRRLQDRFESVLRAAAEQAGVEYVSTQFVFWGHEPCSDLQPRYIDAPSFRIGFRSVVDPRSLHPNLAGQYIYGRAVMCAYHLAARGPLEVAPPDEVSVRLKSCVFGGVPDDQQPPVDPDPASLPRASSVAPPSLSRRSRTGGAMSSRRSGHPRSTIRRPGARRCPPGTDPRRASP